MPSSKTALLLHFNGSDSDVLFLDNSANKHVVTPHGNAQIDSDQSRFGSVSGRFDGAADYLTVDGSTDFVFGSGDFTIDFWLRLNAVDAVQAIYDGRTADADGGVTPYIYVGADNRLRYSVSGGDYIVGTTQLFSGIWYHVALVRSGTSTKLFLNGVQEGSTWSDTCVYVGGTATSPFIGAARQLSSYLNGWLDELRVIQGEAAWTDNFTPSIGPYADPALPGFTGQHGVRVYSGDRHVRRGGDAYAQAFGNLLPTGLAWPRESDSVLMTVVRGLGQVWGNWVDRRAADLLEREADPRITIELLPDWERAWGLPDDCFFGIGQTQDERRKFLVLKMTLKGGQSRDWFVWVSQQLGYEVSVSEFAPFMCGVSRLGDTRQPETAVNKFAGEFITS